ncbi:hypothetical protein ANN_08737 [Periplaneta americana]|uniref:Uncharacterized protein n=1 Tax=Periplaneta americana TaxID=6978 RepID=A0ABQ8T290_PERAM|nr:hypothetical protein ANN_08737 [Periplaneta americana]
MAGLCEGGNEPPGSLKAKIALSNYLDISKRHSNNPDPSPLCRGRFPHSTLLPKPQHMPQEADARATSAPADFALPSAGQNHNLSHTELVCTRSWLLDGCQPTLRSVDIEGKVGSVSKEKGVILDPTIRFEMHEQQPQEVCREKQVIYEPCCQHLGAQYHITHWTVFGLMFGARGTIPRETLNQLKQYNISDATIDAIGSHKFASYPLLFPFSKPLILNPNLTLNTNLEPLTSSKMGDRRNKKTRAKRSSDYFKSEESTETKGEETRGDMGRARHLESPGGSSRDSGSRDQKRKRPTKERWLLTRKTWRYMADAGRRLIPEGAHNRHEDIPKIEAYFQEVCHREPKFLLWRKSSYPGALGFRSHHRKNRGRKKGGSCREKASSADEADAMKIATTGGRLDLQKLKQEFLYGPSTSGSDSSYRQKSYIGSKGHLPDVPETTVTSPDNEEEETERELTETLSKYLSLQERSGDTLSPGEDIADIDYQRLLDQLRKYLSSSNILEDQPETLTTKARKARTQGQGKTLRTTDQRPLTPSPPPLSVSFEGDTPERMTLDILRRYYSRSTCRQKVITDLLTDRKLLEKLYFDLRQTRGFKAGSRGMGRGGSGFVPMTWRKPEHTTLRSRREGEEFCRDDDEDDYDDGRDVGSWKRLGKPIPRAERELSPLSPPPLIEIQHEVEAVDRGIQTDPIPASVLVAIEDELKKSRISAAMEMKEEKSGAGRRRSSVDNDDVSPSVSDTIKRYLRMARKKSIDADKVDRFKRVNYDRNLRNIKPKGEITMPGDDDGLHKGCQPEESWIPALKELKLEDIISDPDISPGGDDLSGSRITSSRSSLDGTGISDDALLSPPPMHVGGKHNPHPSGILSTGQTFLSNLLHGLQYHQQQQQNNEGTATVTQSSTSAATSVGGAAMQKSKSSSSVVHHGTRVAKKIWRSRSKSHSRAISSTTSTWTPQVKVRHRVGLTQEEARLYVLLSSSDEYIYFVNQQDMI